MKRTISVMIGKGSLNHNSRKFTAENVDPDRTHLNISYCNEPIKKVYHELFDEALAKYNEKQTRNDRRIDDYYEKIRTGKQEKLFHEIILQVGDMENMSVKSENGELAKVILDEYFKGFQDRNPTLKVFAAHLHMDEATPHLHIDFVPFTTGSKRGLETRVSLKQALSSLGFKGGSRGNTEWNQWVNAEKGQLAAVMSRYGVEWEQKNTHEEHLSVMNYKKQERAKEVEKLDEQIAEKHSEVKELIGRLDNYREGIVKIEQIEARLEADDGLNLPEPQGIMSAKTYKAKFAEPIVGQLKQLLKQTIVKSYDMLADYYRLKKENRNLSRDKELLEIENSKLKRENVILCKDSEKILTEIKELRKENEDFGLLRKAFGSNKLNAILEKIRAEMRERTHYRDDDWER